MERVTGIGGFFFRADDPAELATWYAQHLGVGFPPESYEDELRLRSWLRRSEAFAALPVLVQNLLDDLDRLDEENAA